MGLKKAELYRGFNVFTEEVRAGAGIAKRARGKCEWGRCSIINLLMRDVVD